MWPVLSGHAETQKKAMKTSFLNILVLQYFSWIVIHSVVAAENDDLETIGKTAIMLDKSGFRVSHVRVIVEDNARRNNARVRRMFRDQRSDPGLNGRYLSALSLEQYCFQGRTGPKTEVTFSNTSM